MTAVAHSFVGVDVSKKTFDFHVLPSHLTGMLPSSTEGARQFIEILRTHSLTPKAIVLEATGGYERRLACEWADAGFPVAIVNPRNVRNFAKALGQRAKNDALDAELTARYAQALQPEIRPLPHADARAFSELSSRRRQLVELRTAEHNRLELTDLPAVRQSIQFIVQMLDDQIAEIERQIEQAVANSPEWTEKEQLLLTVTGIGPVTARALLADIPELGSLNRQQVAALAGLAPYDHDSGTFKGKRSISGGRKHVRSALYMAALTASQKNPTIKNFYDRLIANGKPAKVALTACMRKLLVAVNAMLKDKQPWKNDFPPDFD